MIEGSGSATHHSNDWSRWPTELVQHLIEGVHIGARALLDIKLQWFGLYRSPVPVGRRGVIYFFKWFLPAVAALRGGGGQHPVIWTQLNISEYKAFPSLPILSFWHSWLLKLLLFCMFSGKSAGPQHGGRVPWRWRRKSKRERRRRRCGGRSYGRQANAHNSFQNHMLPTGWNFGCRTQFS